MKGPDTSPTSPPRNPVIPSEKERWQLLPWLPAASASAEDPGALCFAGSCEEMGFSRMWQKSGQDQVLGGGSCSRRRWKEENQGVASVEMRGSWGGLI